MNLISHALAAGAGGSTFGSGRDGQGGFVIAATLNPGHEAKHSYPGDGGTFNLIHTYAGRNQIEGAYLPQVSTVRRLTPTECERLQNVPDGWTCLCGVEPYSTMTCRCPDSPRYRALGNAVTVQVIEWLGRRIKAADARYPSRKEVVDPDESHPRDEARGGVEGGPAAPPPNEEA